MTDFRLDLYFDRSGKAKQVLAGRVAMRFKRESEAHLSDSAAAEMAVEYLVRVDGLPVWLEQRLACVRDPEALDVLWARLGQVGCYLKTGQAEGQAQTEAFFLGANLICCLGLIKDPDLASVTAGRMWEQGFYLPDDLAGILFEKILGLAANSGNYNIAADFIDKILEAVYLPALWQKTQDPVETEQRDYRLEYAAGKIKNAFSVLKEAALAAGGPAAFEVLLLKLHKIYLETYGEAEEEGRWSGWIVGELTGLETKVHDPARREMLKDMVEIVLLRESLRETSPVKDQLEQLKVRLDK